MSDQLVTTAEAAKLARVSDTLIRMWRYRGLLPPSGYDGKRPLYHPLDVLVVERSTRTGRTEHLDGVHGSHPVGWVYYARVDDLVKIGHTHRLRQRVQRLRADLLGAEIGSLELERARHYQHRQYRVHGEWFKADPDLLAAIPRGVPEC